MAVNTKIQVSRGLASLWTSTNPTLSAGEIGYETDTGLFKIGDGTTTWTSLSYNSTVRVLTACSGISISNANGNYTISLSDPSIQVSDITDFVDGVNDRVDDLLTAGSNVQLTYTDNGNDTSTLQIAVTGVSLSGHTHVLSNITDVTASATEVNYIDGSTPGTVVAGKAVVVDSNKNISSFNNLTASGTVNVGAFSSTGNVTVGGDLIVNGNTVTVNSTTVTIDDPVFTLGGDTAPGVDDNKDRGIEFRYNDGTAKLGFFGYDDSTGKFAFLTGATNSSEVLSGTKGEVDASVDWSNINNKPDPVVGVGLTGDVTGSGSVTLTDLASGSFSIATTIAANSVALGTDTTGNYVASIANGNFLTGGGAGSEGAALTLGVDATSANTANKVVARDGTGGFSAGLISATGFAGNGSQITAINASNISTGTLNAARLPTVSQTNTTTGPTATFVSAITVDSNGRVTGANSTTHTLATTSVKGIVSFDSGDFAVNAGVVTVKAGGIDNNQLVNSNLTIGQTALTLGGTHSAISGISAANPVVLTYFSIDGGTP